MAMRQCQVLAVLGALACSTVAQPNAARAEELPETIGAATVIDASHLEVAGQRFKLYGIDAPDTDETCQAAGGVEYPCGIEARDALAKLVSAGEVSCLPRGPNALNEMLASCTVGQTDVARALTEAGWALDERKRTLYYEEAELAARDGAGDDGALAAAVVEECGGLVGQIFGLLVHVHAAACEP